MENKKYIAFIGDSFTWGQGLYLPSWVDRKPKVFSSFKNSNITWIDQQPFIDKEDLKLKDELSFTNIVSTELNRICVKKPDNGGNNSDNVSMLKTIPRLLVNGEPIDFKFENKDIILIFQFTHFPREGIFNFMSEEEKNNLLKFDMVNSRELINKYFVDKVEKYFIEMDSTIDRIAKTAGFEYWYLDWNGDYYKFRPEKFIDIIIGKNKGKYFAPLVDSYKIKVNVGGVEYDDGHLNEEANQIIAESILRWLRDKSRGAGG